MRGVANGEGKGTRELQGLEAHLLDGLGARNGGRRRLVGDGTEHGGGGER